MPESIGSKRRVLPKGVVCDKCNNYFAREVEGPLLAHPSMRNLRAWNQIPNKRGRSPSLSGYIAGTEIGINMRLSSSGSLVFEPERLRDLEHLETELESGLQNGFHFVLDSEPPKKLMSRFLCKMALETYAEPFTWNARDTEILVDEPFLDNVRQFSRFGNKFTEWPYSQRRIYPEDTLMRHPETNEWVGVGFGCTWFMTKNHETYFAFCLYGTEYVINLGGPSIRGYEEWLRDHEGISPVVERLGCYVITEGEGKAQKHFLHGESDSRLGIAFDKQHGYAP